MLINTTSCAKNATKYNTGSQFQDTDFTKSCVFFYDYICMTEILQKECYSILS